MNVQIFGKKKCFDTRKAERFFKERNIKFQAIDILDKGLSKGELEKVAQSVGGIDSLIDDKAKDKDTLAFIQYSPEDTKFEKILENQQILKTPIVRNKNKATVGMNEKIWEEWIKDS
ncbi:MAG: ArsC family transcriptional regulator [Tissierellia bacterium]|nr:ArsC family transcriptional regulator [Tissierellia bacterium]